jgi:oligoribonuclease
MGKEDNLIWMDLEMTGLDPFQDQILEIATVVTDPQLEILAEGPVIALHQPEHVLAALDEWNRHHHGQSGLLERVRNSTCDERQAERETLDVFAESGASRASRRCAATASVRTGASWPAACRGWRPFCTTAISTSAA